MQIGRGVAFVDRDGLILGERIVAIAVRDEVRRVQIRIVLELSAIEHVRKEFTHHGLVVLDIRRLLRHGRHCREYQTKKQFPHFPLPFFGA